jgi:hypothetical protein
MAKGMPAQPIFTNWAGRVIGDTQYDILLNLDKVYQLVIFQL